MMFSYTFKPRLWPTLVTLVFLICLVLLGNWQVERLAWKLSLIEKLENRIHEAPVPLPLDENNIDEKEYLSVFVTGEFDNIKEITMYSIGPNGEPGYDLYTPLILADGRTVIVNRGWVPEQIKQQSDRPASLVYNEVTVTGLLRKPWKKLWYGPENEAESNNWYYGDINQIAKAQLLENVYPMFLYANKIGQDNSYPVAGRTELNIVNNHLDYALTWYGLAIVLMGIYLIAHTNKKSN